MQFLRAFGGLALETSSGFTFDTPMTYRPK